MINLNNLTTEVEVCDLIHSKEQYKAISFDQCIICDIDVASSITINDLTYATRIRFYPSLN